MPTVTNAPRKAAAKKVTRKAAAAVLDNVYVISARSRLLTWTPVYFTEDRAEAYRQLAALEANSIYGSSGFKVTQVKHVRTLSA